MLTRPGQYDDPPIAGPRSPAGHYDTLETDDVAAYHDPSGRAIKDLAEDNAIFYLWATFPMLPAALTVMRAWDFAYRSHLIWDKGVVGMGYLARNRHELLLIGKKGALARPDPQTLTESVLQVRRSRRHSEKPAMFRQMIEAQYPTLAKIELFARLTSAPPGWDIWGLEAGAPDAGAAS